MAKLLEALPGILLLLSAVIAAFGSYYGTSQHVWAALMMAAPFLLISIIMAWARSGGGWLELFMSICTAIIAAGLGFCFGYGLRLFLEAPIA